MAPVRTLVMRHAEKPDDPGNPNLSAAGRARAKALAAWYPETFGPPDFIFAAAPSKHSERPVQTVQPLADALGIALHMSYVDEDYGTLADTLLSKPKFEGKAILICWHHRNIPGLMRTLGAPEGSYPEPWAPAMFNLVLAIDFLSDGPKVSQIFEPF